MLHVAMMPLMIGSAIAAAACCLGAGRVAPLAVPWQARQSAVVMALGMLALCAGDGDARVLLLVVAGGIVSAMLGVVGTRGRVHADACFHRALGCVVMAMCALAMLGAGAGSGAAVSTGHVGHGALVPMSLLVGAGVAVLLALMLAARVRHQAGSSAGSGAGAARGGAHSGQVLLKAEGIAMAISLIVMAAMVLAG